MSGSLRLLLLFVFIRLSFFCLFRPPAPKKNRTNHINQENQAHPTPKSHETDPLGLLKGPIGASLRFMHLDHRLYVLVRVGAQRAKRGSRGAPGDLPWEVDVGLLPID